jgi:cytochrome c-type biogenesis protein CcmE
VNPRRRRLLVGVALVVLGTGAAAALALRAFQENLLYFYSPSQVAAGEAPAGRAFRVGGLVAAGSFRRDAQSLVVSFALTDTLHSVDVVYDGVLPDLFREGQGVVANGRLLADGRFRAEQVLAKHDENYMPPEVAESLAKAGVKIPHEAFRQQP